MALNAGMVLCFISSWSTLALSQNTISIQDLTFSNCRISGVFLVQSGNAYNLNYSAAEKACKILETTLANKSQVEEANKNGLETCKFGWVIEKISLISRVRPNAKCGQNKTGVMPWHATTETKFDAFCFNAADRKTNSCEPLIFGTPPTAIKTKVTALSASYISTTLDNAIVSSGKSVTVSSLGTTFSTLSNAEGSLEDEPTDGPALLIKEEKTFEDLTFSNCRISGVFLVQSGNTYNLNYSAAGKACKILGTTLASKSQVEKANKNGLETCKFGWVIEKISLISRVRPNTKCGQNKTGVMPWHAATERKFDAFCFSAADRKTNSCEPLIFGTPPTATKTTVTTLSTSYISTTLDNAVVSSGKSVTVSSLGTIFSTLSNAEGSLKDEPTDGPALLIREEKTFEDLTFSNCRISGVFLAQSGNAYNLNHSAAEKACKILGTTLASKSQVEEANKNGLETCKFGWVTEKITLISRVRPNTKCGQNKTGVMPWYAATKTKFDAFCFNAADRKTNSCEPLISGTPPTAVKTKVITRSTSYILATLDDGVVSSGKSATVSSLGTIFRTLSNAKQSLEDEPTHDPALLISGEGTFGVLPTALLVLALVCLAAAVALALWYIKKYKKNTLFSENKEENETFETQVLKHWTSKDNNCSPGDHGNDSAENQLQSEYLQTTECNADTCREV